MATYTLAQYAQNEKNPLAKAMMMGISMEGSVADIFNWRSLGGAISESGVRYDEVISPDWIGLDGTIASKSANGKPLAYSVYEMAVHIDVPVLLEDSHKNQVGGRSSARQVALAYKGAAYEMNNAFINGDHAVDANQFEGLNKLVSAMGTAQTVGATEIDLTASYTDALAESLWRRLELGVYAIEGHKPTAAFADSAFLLVMRSFARQNKMLGNDFDWMNASFNVGDPRLSQRTAATRPALVWEGIPFYDLATKADQTTKVIGTTYTEGGSTSAGTRVFFVKEGPDDLEGIMASPLEVVDIGVLEAKDNIRKRVKWTPGLAAWGPRCISKVQGLKT